MEDFELVAGSVEGMGVIEEGKLLCAHDWVSGWLILVVIVRILANLADFLYNLRYLLNLFLAVFGKRNNILYQFFVNRLFSVRLEFAVAAFVLLGPDRFIASSDGC